MCGTSRTFGFRTLRQTLDQSVNEATCSGGERELVNQVYVTLRTTRRWSVREETRVGGGSHPASETVRVTDLVKRSLPEYHGSCRQEPTGVPREEVPKQGCRERGTSGGTLGMNYREETVRV